MFGIYRTVLALLVVLQHLGEVPVVGKYAVFGFYILSGYLMTAIMHHNYGFSSQGIFRYAVNRGLRIYPVYWVACLFTLGLMFLFGVSTITDFHSAMRYPSTFNEIVKNAFILFPDLSSARLSPPAWALTVELFFYALIGFGLSRSMNLVIVWFFCSVLYHVTASSPFFPWSDTYFSFAAASLPFSTGALIFFQRHRFRAFVIRNQVSILATLSLCFILNSFFVNFLVWKNIGFYLSFVICSFLVLALSFVDLQGSAKVIDKWVGDLSYPIYLMHFQVGFLCIAFFQLIGFSADLSSPVPFLIAVIVTLAVSQVVVVALQSPIDRVRDLVRTAGRSTDDSPREVSAK
ncbi:acyltransferase family protein [Haliea sp.]|uniref:acyltransferase family protein n=1 Tax=Haliea sp. TaxID=1932666 RepID=UPI0035299284